MFRTFALWYIPFFSRARDSIRLLVGPLVRWSVTSSFWLLISLFWGLQRLVQPHAIDVAAYTALFSKASESWRLPFWRPVWKTTFWTVTHFHFLNMLLDRYVLFLKLRYLLFLRWNVFYVRARTYQTRYILSCAVKCCKTLPRPWHVWDNFIWFSLLRGLSFSSRMEKCSFNHVLPHSLVTDINQRLFQ